MSESLLALISAARKIEMSPKQKEEQRRSFAFGNTNIENSRITRSLVDEQASMLAAKNG